MKGAYFSRKIIPVEGALFLCFQSRAVSIRHLSVQEEITSFSQVVSMIFLKYEFGASYDNRRVKCVNKSEA